MLINKFIDMLHDKGSTDYRKMLNKYGESSFREYIAEVKSSFMRELPLPDFNGQSCFYLPFATGTLSQYSQILAHRRSQPTTEAMEDEIIATLAIESIVTTRKSVRLMINGYQPQDEAQTKALGIKRGLEFIADPVNMINAINLRELYRVAVEDGLKAGERLLPDNNYRHEPVLDKLLSFLSDSTDGMDVLHKSAIAHYYFAYLHPYFDGNGRMARLLQQWYLLQNGYDNSLIVAMSGLINNSRKLYYKTFTVIERNRTVVGFTDITLFVQYFTDHVLANIRREEATNALNKYFGLLQTGEIIAKERDLFAFVLNRYGKSEFATKQLERDFANAAYATIRAFVLRFAGWGILDSVKFSTKVKYRVRS